MGREIHLVATLLCFVPRLATPQVPTPAAAVVEPPAARASAAPQWRSMSHAKVTSALSPQAPMATDLAAQAPPAQWANVPLPPPPAVAGKPAPQARTNGTGAAAGAAALVAPASVAGAPAGASPAALEGARAGAAPAAQPSAFQPRVFAAPGSPLPPAGGAPAAEGAQGATSEPKVDFAADHTGAMVSITQDLESDRVRQDWAAQGGQIPAYEANAGMMIMYKALPEMGSGANMSGVGLNGGIRLSLLSLTPPKYETRDRSWTAFKIGGGIDLGVMSVTMSMPYTCLPVPPGGCYGGPQSASMTSVTLVGTIGVMRAFGSFDSPSDWSGFAIGAEWAPSHQSTTLTISDGSAPPTTTSSFNATGFALSFESGSMKAMAMKMGKKARMKIRLFLLPAVGDLPFLMTASIGGVWY